MAISEMFWIGSAIVSLATFAVSITITRNICDPSSRLHVLDHPNERSLHTHPTPRTGGVAIVTAALSGFAMLILWRGMGDFLPWLILSTTIMAVLSYIDDHRGLSVPVRLLGHWVCAGILVVAGLVLPVFSLPGAAWLWPVWASIVFSLLFMIWMVNLYNFMDGMDGFAGGMAVIGFATLSLFGILVGNEQYAIICAITAAAAAGFLWFNFPPARIFMGDVGSSTLGLLAAALSLWGVKDGIFPFWAAVLVFSPFIADATVTLLQRLWRGERIWQAHKKHYYQQLVQAGWGHRRTVLVQYVIMFACGATALWGMLMPEAIQIMVLVGWFLFYIVFFFLVSQFRKRHLIGSQNTR